MECLIGIRAKNFVLIATDSIAARSIVLMKKDHNKTFQLSDRLLMAVAGDSGDAVQFAEYIAKNIQLYRMRNGYDLSVKGATSFTRRNLADSLRTSSAYQVNLLLGGYDDVDGAGLYYMDYLGACVSVPYAVHGYGSFFSLSVFDRHYKPDMTKDEAIHLLQMVIDEIAERFIVNLGQFKVKIIDKGGVEEHKADLGPTRPDPSAMHA